MDYILTMAAFASVLLPIYMAVRAEFKVDSDSKWYAQVGAWGVAMVMTLAFIWAITRYVERGL